jgi:FG-GAP-like repeat
MNLYVSTSTRLLAVTSAALLFHSQLAFADGCSLPTFGGARLFPAANGSQAFAMGDFNGDGLPDLAVANTGGASVSILLGMGDGTFQKGANLLVRSPSDIKAADFNGDGILDLVIWDTGGLGMVTMLGNGDGTFKPALTAARQGGSMAVGDFNKDGKLDLAITGTPAYIMLGNGNGTFQDPVAPPGGIEAAFGVVAADFNGDGKLDVIAGVTGGISLMPGDGTGKLAAGVKVSAGTSFLPDNILTGDLNGDGKPDVVTVTSLDHKAVILLNNGNGTFLAPITYDVGELAKGAVIADLNGDGVPDFAVEEHTSISAPGTISVFAGVGDGTLQAPVHYNPTVQANWALGAGDFNSDGVPDLVFTSIVQNLPTQVGVMLGNGDGTFQTPRSFASGGPLARTPVLADFNGDGVLDMAVPNAGINGKLGVMLGNPDGTFQDAVNLNTAFGAKSAAVGDMNGDGKPDIVVANGISSNVLVFLSNGDGTFQSPKATGSLFLATYIALGDFNNDGKLDAAVRGISGAQVIFGNGDGTFRSSIATYGGTCTGCGQGPILTADLNGDGNMDIVLANGDTDQTLSFGQSGSVTVLLGKGDGTFLAPVNYPIGANITAVAAADLNGDGKPELVASDFGGGNGLGATGGALGVLINNGDGTFQAPVKYSSAQGASWVVAGDFDGDGLNDVAVLGRNSKTVMIYLGVGDGTLRNALSYGSGSADPVGMAMADVNADGKPDLLIGDQTPGAVLTLLNTYIPGTAASACTAVPALRN